MAEFKSHYQALGFYVDGEFKRFGGGRYVTDDKAEIAVLENLTDVTRVDEPKTEESPAPKSRTAKPKSSGK